MYKDINVVASKKSTVFTVLNSINADLSAWAAEMLPEGEYVFLAEGDICHVFLGHCAECGKIVRTVADWDWSEDSDHCAECGKRSADTRIRASRVRAPLS